MVAVDVISDETPTLADVIASAMDNRIGQIYTAIPGTVVKYSAANRMADIQPAVQKKYIDDLAPTPEPIVVQVPVVFPSSANFKMTWPINPGDSGLMIFCHRSIDSWLSVGGIAAPTDNRKHDISDAVFVPGLMSIPQAVAAPADAANFIVEHGLSKITLTPAGDVKINGGAVGKMAIGNAAAELLSLFDQMLTAMIASTRATLIGPQPLDPVTLSTLNTIKALLAQIKGSL